MLCLNIQYTKLAIELICILMMYGEVQVYYGFYTFWL